MSGKMGLVTTPKRSQLMGRVKQSETSAEIAVRRLVRQSGFHYRTKASDLPGTPDLVNRRKKWAIFVNGCFWHAHERCPKATVPNRNRSFWIKKFKDNRRRDEKNIHKLNKLRFSVLVVWECELEDETKLQQKICLFFKLSEVSGN